MLHTISVPTAPGKSAAAAYGHAVDLSKAFDATLRVNFVSEPLETAEAEDPDLVARADTEARATFEPVRKIAEGAGVAASMSIRREGVAEGLLSTAAESDLVVLGLDPEHVDDDPDRKKDYVRTIREAESSLAVVSEEPREMRKVLVAYEGGPEGKSALRLTGELAQRTGAEVVVSARHGDVAEAGRLENIARTYFEGFRDLNVSTRKATKGVGSESETIRIAETEDADAIVVGGDTYGMMDRFLDTVTPEDFALKTRLPVFVSR